MSERIIGLVVLAFCATGSFCCAQMGKIDTKHVSEKSFLVMRFDIERVIAQVKDAEKGLDQISKQIKQETSIDVSALKCITIQFGDQSEDERDPSFAMTFEFNKDFDQQEILDEFVNGRTYEEDSINGKTYMKADRQNGPHMYFESKRKFTAATQGGIKLVLEGGGGMGQIAAQLKSSPPGSEMTLVFNRTEQSDEAFDNVARPLTRMTGPINLQELIKQGEAGLAVVNLSGGIPLSVELKLNSADAAEKTKKELDSLIAMGKPMIAPTKAMLEAQIKELSGDDGIEAMQRNAMNVGLKGLAVANKILNTIQVESKNKVVNVQVKHMGGFPQVADLVVQGMQYLLLATGSDAAPRAAPPALDRAIEKKVEVRPIKKR